MLAAVGCAVTTHTVKFLVDTLAGHAAASGVWLAFLLLAALIAADNLLWRVAGWIASSTFVRVTGDLRRDLFRHLTGHAPSYFIERLPGMLTSRVTATSNAVYTVENMFVWNVLPPCAGTVGAIAFVLTVSGPMAAVLVVVAVIVVVAMFRLAAAGKPLHHDFADKAAAVDGEMVDVIGNMPVVRAFGGIMREHKRFDGTLDREMGARAQPALPRAAATSARGGHRRADDRAAGLGHRALAARRRHHRRGGAGVHARAPVLHATRDLAVALVDVTQHMARLSEALATLWSRTSCATTRRQRRWCGAVPASRSTTSFSYPDGRKVFTHFNLRLAPGQRVGLVGRSGSGKSTLLALLQRFYDVQRGRILIDGQEVSRVTQQSMREAISVVPQDISLFIAR